MPGLHVFGKTFSGLKNQLVKKPMLVYGKIMPQNNQCSVLWPELMKKIPRKSFKKFCPKLRIFLPRRENVPNTRSPANVTHTR